MSTFLTVAILLITLCLTYVFFRTTAPSSKTGQSATKKQPVVDCSSSTGNNKKKSKKKKKKAQVTENTSSSNAVATASTSSAPSIEKKMESSIVSSKKSQTKKVDTKKVDTKKVETKKVESKKVESKKVKSKKVESKKFKFQKPVEEKVEEESDTSSSDDDMSVARILSKRHFTKGKIPSQNRTIVVAKFEVDQAVEAKFQQAKGEYNGMWFPGKITKSRGRTYTVAYDDGEVEYNVPEKNIRSMNDMELKTVDQTADEDTCNQKESSSPTHSSDSLSSGGIVDEGWEIVGATSKKKTVADNVPRFDVNTGEEILTKKQRESRRRKEVLREKKTAVREESQDKGLHARWGGKLNPQKKYT